MTGVPPDAKHLLVAPDGVLYLIPFEVLPLSSGRLAIEQMAVSYLPSAALLARPPGRDTPMMPWRRQLLALGDPLVDGSGALPGDPHWRRLPESARELAFIGQAVPGHAEVHSGADDRKQYLTRSTPLLHLATHAVVDTADASRSRILFTPETGRAGSEYLFRGEVASLPLAETDLVTLSACDTEPGLLSRREGVPGFSRAFLAAGARATVTALWRVEDRATADFMHVFYQHLALGEPKAEALRAAKPSFLRQGGARSQPLYWAAIMLNGEGQEPIRPVLSWGWIVAAGLGLAAALTVFRCLYSRRP
jgi:CHAT domain-containing protein